jgi:CBS domain-containing protein
MLIEELMTRSPTTVTPSMTLAEAARKMKDGGVGSVVVADEDDVLGVLTDRDIALALAFPPEFDAESRVDQVMTPRPVTIEAGVQVPEGLEKMRAHAIRRLVVVDSRGRLVGVVSLDDVLVHLGNTMEVVADLVREEVAVKIP